jgi:vancomycin permeability regulator SanA
LERVLTVALLAGLAAVAFLGGLRLWVEQKYRDRIYASLNDVPPRPTAIVLGAGLWPDGSITPVLADRVATAVDLYHAGTVETLLLSGARRPGYDEPVVMLDYAVGLGVPQEAILLDPEGFRTYDTCRRARGVWRGAGDGGHPALSHGAIALPVRRVGDLCCGCHS